MRKFILLTAISAVIMSGCSQSSDEGTGVIEANAIGFRPVLEKSRASVVAQTSDFTSFFVQADKDGDYDFSFLKASVYFDGSSWVYAPIKYFPVDGTTPVGFYAYAPVKDVNMTSDLAFAGINVTFEYTVPVNQNELTTATDLLVASATGLTSANTTGGQVPLDFTHALSAVTFSASNLNVATSELTYVISKIEITDMDNVGTYNYTTNAWTMGGTLADYIAGVPASGVAVVPGASSVKLLSENDVMMVLPQEPALGTLPVGNPVAGTYVAVTFSLKDGSGQFIYEDYTRYLALPAGFEFEQGKRYNFAFEFDALTAIVLKVTFTDWAPESIIPID